MGARRLSDLGPSMRRGIGYWCLGVSDGRVDNAKHGASYWQRLMLPQVLRRPVSLMTLTRIVQTYKRVESPEMASSQLTM